MSGAVPLAVGVALLAWGVLATLRPWLSFAGGPARYRRARLGEADEFGARAQRRAGAVVAATGVALVLVGVLGPA